MAKTIEQLKAQGAEVKNATVVGENTATRVGTLFTDIVEYIEQATENGATTTNKLAPLAVTTEKIANGAVTTEKLADSVRQTIIYDVSSHNDGAVFESISALLSSSNLSTLIPTSVRHGGMTIRFIQGSEQSSDNKYVQYRLMADTFTTDEIQWQSMNADNTVLQQSRNLIESGAVFSQTRHTVVKDERVNAGSTQQIVRFGELRSGEKVHIKVSNETGKSITHFYLLYRTTDMTIIQQWSSAFEADIEIEDTAEYALYTNIADGGNLSYDVYIVINGNIVDELYQGFSENKSNIERLEAKTDYTVDTVHVEQTTPTQNIITINNVYAGAKIRIKCDIVSGVPEGVWMFNFLSEYWTDENEHTFIISDDGNYNFYTNINEAATVSNFIYDVKIERIGEAANDPTINSIENLVGIGSSEQYGDFNSSVQVDNILKFNSFKTSRENANTQQINHIGVLPAGTVVRLVIYNYKVITGSGFFVHFISYNKHDGKGYINLARLDYSGTIEVTLEEELDIYTISNAGPDTTVNYDLICQYGTALPTVSTKTYIAAWKDDVVSEDSLLKSIHIYTPNGGLYTFGIGTVDWRPIAIISKTFNINLSAGDNIIDLTDRKIILRAGEKLFQYINKNGYDGLCGYTIQASDQHFLFGDEIGLLSEYSGKGLAFEAEYQSINSVFALKKEVETISDNVESNSETIQEISSSVNIVKDANGNNYELMVVNGVVTPILMQYSKALIMGNSLSLGMDSWDNPYGMLATKANMDYVSHILSALQSKVPNASVYKEVSSHTLEKDLLSTDFDSMFAKISNWDFDLIIYQGGENVSSNRYSQYQQALENLMVYLKGKCPTAKFVITGVVLADIPVLENAAKNVANSIGAKYVYCNGHTPDVIIGVSNIWYNKIDNIYEPSDYTKQTHPNDLGFLNLANAILSAIGYRQIEKKHSINISNASIQYSSPKVGVEGGIITIKTYENAAPSISVTDMNNNVLQVTHYKLSDFSYDNRFADGTTDPATYSSTFDMPASDVTVVIQ